MADIYRTIYTNKTEFTYEKSDNGFKSRIDRIYVPLAASSTCECAIIDNVLSDHKAFGCTLKFENINKRGPGYWHLNVSLLGDHALKAKLKSDLILKKITKLVTPVAINGGILQNPA